jgi:hypothetical protein
MLIILNKKLHACCVQVKINHERDVLCAFILGLLAWIQTVYLQLDTPDLMAA